MGVLKKSLFWNRLGNSKTIMTRLTKTISFFHDSLYWHNQKLISTNNCFITCAESTEGPGTQIQAVLSTMLFANELGIKYVHTPFKKIHPPVYIKKIGYNLENEKSYASKWESFTNLGFNELTVDQIKSDKLDAVQVSHPRQVKKIKNTLYVISNCHKFADRNPSLYLKLAPQIRQKYAESTEKPNLYFDPSKINVAIHLRRGDVTKASHPKRYTSNRFVLSVIEEISTALSDLGQKPVFHIFSQNNTDIFFDIEQYRIIFHPKECPFAAFHHMVSANVLVMAKSSFSYSVALFSKGIIIYEPFWHKPLNNWIVVNKKGSFNKKKFRNRIKHKNRKTYNS